MISIEASLANKMKEAEPALDVTGPDRKILQVAYQDFMNYLKYNSKLTGQNIDNNDLAGIIEEIFGKDPSEFESFLSVWTGMWLHKWNGRVKLLFGNQSQTNVDKHAEAISKGEPLWNKLECKQEMTEIVIATLIKNAEICGTQVLAEHILKTELGKKGNQDINDKEQILSILNSALRRARDIAQTASAFIFLRIDSGYFRAARKQEIQ